MEFSDIKVGKYIVADDRPCKILRVETSKPGKHGSAKKRVKCVDLITDKKLEALFRHSSLIDVPLITKRSFDVIDINNNCVTYMDEDGNDCITIMMNNNDKELYESGLERFNDGEELEVCIMHISYNTKDEEYYRVIDIRSR